MLTPFYVAFGTWWSKFSTSTVTIVSDEVVLRHDRDSPFIEVQDFELTPAAQSYLETGPTMARLMRDYRKEQDPDTQMMLEDLLFYCAAVFAKNQGWPHDDVLLQGFLVHYVLFMRTQNIPGNQYGKRLLPVPPQLEEPRMRSVQVLPEAFAFFVIDTATDEDD